MGLGCASQAPSSTVALRCARWPGNGHSSTEDGMAAQQRAPWWRQIAAECMRAWWALPWGHSSVGTAASFSLLEHRGVGSPSARSWVAQGHSSQLVESQNSYCLFFSPLFPLLFIFHNSFCSRRAKERSLLPRQAHAGAGLA